MHCQVEVWPALGFEGSVVRLASGRVVHEAAARVGPSGSQVTGPARRAPTLKEARKVASVALLEHLAGVTDEAAGGLSDWTRVTLPGMSTEVFEAPPGGPVRRRV